MLFVYCTAADYEDNIFDDGLSLAAAAQDDGDSLIHLIDLCGSESDADCGRAALTGLPMEVIEDEEPNWECVRCTFLNHPALSTCECCLFEQALAPSEYIR